MTSCVPQADSLQVFLGMVFQSMALVMSRFHESHPKKNHSLVLSKRLLSVVESCSDCATPFLDYFDKFLIFFFFFNFKNSLLYSSRMTKSYPELALLGPAKEIRG